MSPMKTAHVKRSSFMKTISKGIIASSILVSSSLLVPEMPFLPSETVAHAASGPIYTVTADVLNVRSGAGTNYSKIGSLTQGAQLNVTDKLSSGWYKISYNGKTGYVSGDYVYTPPVIYKVTASNLNVRTGPGTQYSKIGMVSNGTVLNVIHKGSNGWFKISFNGKTGYVSGDYVGTSGATTKRMDIPVIAQRPELPSGCEVTALSMALRYHGIKVDKTVLAKKMPYDSTKLVRNADGSIKIWGDPSVGFVGTPFGNGYTINPAPLKKVLDQYRSGGLALTGKSFSEIEKYTLQGKPVLVWFTINHEMPVARQWKTPAGKTINAARPLHNIVITGTDANYVYFNDSESVKKDVRMSKAKFINIYNAMGKRALVVN
jgi:uncharacterized protein YvpB